VDESRELSSGLAKDWQRVGEALIVSKDPKLTLKSSIFGSPPLPVSSMRRATGGPAMAMGSSEVDEIHS
jgi:hypothetical protein